MVAAVQQRSCNGSKGSAETEGFVVVKCNGKGSGKVGLRWLVGREV